MRESGKCSVWKVIRGIPMSIKIMIVDDTAFMRMTLKKILTEGGFTVVGEAGDGAQAVQLYKAIRPELVTLDITMPVMDGLQAAKEILAFDPLARIIMVSAMGQQAMVVSAIKSGAKDFIVKPFDAERIISAVYRAWWGDSR